MAVRAHFMRGELRTCGNALPMSQRLVVFLSSTVEDLDGVKGINNRLEARDS